ncbi:MAG: non-ribosomal peptide synthetase/polyketide synthase [Chitinophaga sp.]|nr:non-ribosomal peptide synthetase/polyketide synthase [Chitinophaga sp.]
MSEEKKEYQYSISELFEIAAQKHANKTALKDRDTLYTYTELNERANQIAHCLRKKSVHPNDFVVLLLEPGTDFILFILAIIKIGAVYVPVDTLAPPERLKDIIDDTKPTLVITNDEGLPQIKPIHCKSILARQINLESISYPKENPKIAIPADSPIYMMYTSGSTGKPKGVIIPHHAVVNLVKIENYAAVQAGEVVAQLSNLAFDGSTFEIWSALLNGATLCIIPLTARSNHNELHDILQKNQVHYLFLPTGFFHQLIKSVPQTLDSVNTLIFGGEQVNHHLVRTFLHFRKQQKNPVVLINGYGPTEATTFTCKQLMTEESLLTDEQISSIGTVISNVKTYILDEKLEEAIEGELYISGINLALGYHNSVHNQKKFIPNPYANQPPYERLYKTGDKVRLLPSGELLCLGRLDDQVKIGGFRIHLNEIEQQLMKNPDIDLAAVTVEMGGGQHQILTAYLVFSKNKNPTHADEIRLFLSKSLPSYMLPAKYVMVEELPLTAVGKVDKKSLLQLPHTDLSFHVDTSSSSSIEESIKKIWQHLLNRSSIDVHKNLFDLGANSLLITEACTLINQTLNCEVQLSEILAYPSIHKLSRYLEGDIDLPYEKNKKTIHPTDIAVVGMSGRFPKANTIDEFWDNLCQGLDCLTRFDTQSLNNMSEASNFVPVKGILTDIDYFDAPFFGFSPVDARTTDPQHRVFLECVWEALEHAGIAPEKNPSKTISVFAGMTDSSYLQEHLLKSHWFCNEHDSFQQRIATSIGMLSTQVSYRLNLKGRSVNVNTACSTGLMTVDHACQDLIMGHSDIALAGASSITVPQEQGYFYQEGSIVSQDGYCRPFSDKANGTVFSNGVGVVVLKRLSDAVEDGDTIYAVIKSRSVNNDGLDKLGFTAPSLSGQMSCIRDALEQAQIKAEDIGLVEAHGTATALGDIIEINALTSVYRKECEQQGYCALGSVKANIGHTDVTAGIAGFIKTVLCLYHKKIPPLIHFNAPNPNLLLEESPFFINKELIDWDDPVKNRYAAVSAFGVGGTNVHLILSDYKAIPSTSAPAVDDALFLFSASSQKALEERVYQFYEYMRATPHSSTKWADAAYTLQTGRKDFQWRQYIISKDLSELKEKIPYIKPCLYDDAIHHSLVWMLGGQGTQYHQMGMTLYHKVPLFRHYVDRGVELAKPYLDTSLLDVLTTNAHQLTQTQYAQPALFIMEYALSQVLLHCGIRPAALIGHSLGEYVAACIADVFSFEDGVALVCERGLLMAKAESSSMLALVCTEEELLTFKQQATVDIALHNGTNHWVLAGTTNDIQLLESHLQSINMPFHRLNVSHAFHSYLMEPLEHSFKEIFANITLSPPKIPIVSNLTGTWLSASEVQNPDYWYRHLRHTVQFCSGIQLLLHDQNPFFIEVGFGQGLCNLVNNTSEGTAKTCATLSGAHQKNSDVVQLYTCFGELWRHGIKVDIHKLFEIEKRQHIPLPTYPFQRQRYWIEPDKELYSSKIHYFKPVWSNKKINTSIESVRNSIEQHTWIIIKDQHGLADQFIELVKSCKLKPIIITFSNTYSCEGSNYSINPKQKKHYLTLINTIRSQLTNPILLNLASFGLKIDGTSSHDHIEHQLQWGFDNLLYLSQALTEEINQHNSFRIAIITHGTKKIMGTESINPFNAMLLSACRVMMQEQPKILFKLFDIHEEQRDQQLLYKIIDSCIHKPWDLSNLLEVYRNNYAWHATFSEIPIKRNKIKRLKDNGIYMLTGGLGGIALSCCEAIAQTVVNPQFILLSRRAIPDDSGWEHLSQDTTFPYQNTITRLLKIKQLGAHITVLQTDITDLNALEQTVQQCIVNFGTVNGLIHTAGTSHPALAQTKTYNSTRTVFSPKIIGTLNLIQCFKKISLDFVALKSSLSSILGGFEYADYAAANAFLDAVSTSDLFQTADFVLTINWNTWNEVGIAAQNKIAGKTSFIGKGDDISTEEGKKIFIDILEGDETQIAVSKMNINDINTSSPSIEIPISSISRDNLFIPTEYLKPGNEMERLIVDIWQHVLGIDPIGLSDNFFSLGGHSLLAFSLMEKINKLFSCSFPMTQIYTTPTIQQLCYAISNESMTMDVPIITSLKTVSEEKNLFLCHPISGLINCYDSFVNESDLPMSLYGLQDPFMNANALPYNDLDSMIEDYYLAIKRIQPRGPYYFIGYSFGGVVCYELANKLRKEQEEIAFLCLIDSWAIIPVLLQEEHSFKSYIKTQNTKLPDSIINLAWEREQLLINHEITKSNQNILLLKASDVDDYFIPYNNLVNGWANYNEGRIVCHSIKSTHETILEKSNCLTMLYLIKEYLKEQTE